ncbi:MAG: endo-1,4-beta-xylanase [Candidatus Ornithomonoglobus sp.]
MINGLDDEYRLRDGTIQISGTARKDAVLYAALYSDERLSEVKTLNASGDFNISMDCGGADTLKLFAWDESMAPYIENLKVNSEGTGNYQTEAQSMKEKYKNDFLIGNIYNTKNLFGADKEMLLKHFNVITAENLMKPEVIAPEKGVYNWNDADMMVDFAEANGLEVIGHTLVWHQQTPDWLTTGTQAEVYEQMRDYIHTVVGRYKGRVKGWDVVNEAVRDNISEMPTKWTTYIRKDSEVSGSKWYRALNDAEYIYNAFVYAHEADPDAELYYNDYNLDSPYKREAAALLVKHINDKYKTEYNTDENLVDAIGMQSHYHLKTDVNEVRASIARFREIGVKVNISELDVCLVEVADNGLGDTSTDITLTPSLETRQAAKYAELMSIYKANSDIIDRVTFWGYSDAASWRSAQYPLMFNGDFTPKKAYYAIMEPELYR